MATQQERRESAIARLLEAAIATIAETGYASASASAITSRAGLSHGALFRHFPTMSDFMAATAEEALGRQLADFTARVAVAGDDLDVATVLRILRAVMGSVTNLAVYELVNAARTDAELRDVLQERGVEYLVTVRDVARGLPGMKDLPEELFDTLLLLVTDVFDAEALLRSVRPLSPDQVERRDVVLEQLYAQVMHPGSSLTHQELA